MARWGGSVQQILVYTTYCTMYIIACICVWFYYGMCSVLCIDIVCVFIEIGEFLKTLYTLYRNAYSVCVYGATMGCVVCCVLILVVF